uniref:SUEL-type lectin domain-containing protein n=1 Tax=Salarias fasciatus TaxID=181472 RepID=A0A672HB94_SALFA
LRTPGKTAKLRCGKILLVLLCPQHFTPLVSPVVVISVVKANYGRLDGKKCSRGRSRAQLGNVRCKNPAKKVAQRCNGKRRCNLRASNSVFGDPCRGTYKYLEVDFVCKSEVTCEGKTAKLRCGKILLMFFHCVLRLTCLLPPVFTPHISIHRCNGKRRCNLKASNSVFGDPCRGTYKYLEVDFVCKSE